MSPHICSKLLRPLVQHTLPLHAHPSLPQVAVSCCSRRTLSQRSQQRSLHATPSRDTIAAPSTSRQMALSVHSVNPRVKDAEYAVRGELVIRAEAIKKELKQGKGDWKFDKVVQCNIGNPQDLGQKPITFYRQVLALCHYPQLLDSDEGRKLFPEDVLKRAKQYIDEIHTTGAYTHSQGIAIVRQQVADYINKRDGSSNATPDNIYLIDGASSGVKTMLSALLSSEQDGILIPIPQYPLYTAALTLFGGQPIKYYLDEAKHWSLTRSELDKSLKEAKSSGIKPKAIVIINPGNPTGQVLQHDIMVEIVKFAEENQLMIMADEVYQSNIYEDTPFTSFKAIVNELSSKVELVSFHSISKGYYGECGQRGGYMELVNIDPEVMAILYKLASISLCSNVSGQLLTGLMCQPPQQGDASYELYNKERTGILESLKRRAIKVVDTLNKLQGITCNSAQGALYAFPTIQLPQKAVDAAKKQKKTPDAIYCLELLEATGLCVVPGSGFGQRDGTFHFRTTILPSEEDLDSVLDRYGDFHNKFMRQYAD